MAGIITKIRGKLLEHVLFEYERNKFENFENYCSACDNFEDRNKCPFYGKVTPDTEYAQLGCKNFWD